jgi:hypothetical protein
LLQHGWLKALYVCVCMCVASVRNDVTLIDTVNYKRVLSLIFVNVSPLIHEVSVVDTTL